MLQFLDVLTQVRFKRVELSKYQLTLLDCLFKIVVSVCKDCAVFTFYFETQSCFFPLPFNIKLQDFLRVRQRRRDRCDERADTREVVSLATAISSKLL